MSQHHHLYNNTRWRRKRDEQLGKEPLCRFCLAAGRIKAATVADHIEPHNGDEDKFWNGELQSLCKTPCHDSVKKQMEMGGKVRGCDEAGLPTDMNHPWRKEA